MQQALVRAGQQSGDCYGAGAHGAADCPSRGFGVIALSFRRIRRPQPHGETARLLSFGGRAARISALALVRAASPSSTLISPATSAARTKVAVMHACPSKAHGPRVARWAPTWFWCVLCAHRPDWRRCAHATTETKWRWTVRQTNPPHGPPALPTSPIPPPRWADQHPDQRVKRICICNRLATAERPH